ncbi:Similar to Probable quinate permease; acc. no. Q2U2Y9 [Pyronema omphalodes CBS 100304]|uniref:Similar to Probable quinate permease acc. no. Q2U2Y9 n=1 Tax=Pyronema omphalodes (strain CBS 100304) TaxID=1076935 RepID=U4KU06_PYROM|nr:Similar to Probable quinate permease; acc. no. Q2U2Y9 [Pyronema omphalodes CBS 100304]
MFHAENANDPKEVRNWRVQCLALGVSMSAVAMGFDTAFIGGTQALESFKRDYGLNRRSQLERDTLSGNIVSTFQAGCMVGSLLTFPLVERYGRRLGMIGASAVFCIGAAIMTAAAGRLSMIYAGRAITGLGIGSASLIVPVYIAETSPPSIRGRLVGIFEVLSQGGGMLGFWINYIVDRTISPVGPKQYLIPIGLQLLPGALLFFVSLFAIESPRWLCKQDNWEQARKNLVWLRHLPVDSDYITEELRGIREQIEYEKAKSPGGSWGDKWKEMKRKGNRNRIGIGLLLMACQNLTGVNILTYYSPRIFETLGLTGTSTKLFATGCYGIAKTTGMVIFALWLVERVGRRKGLIYGAFIGSLPMWYIGGYVMKADPAKAASSGQFTSSGWGYLAMVCVYLYGMIYCMSWQGITWVYCSEIFPIGIRMLCVALTTADQWLWSFIISRTTPYMITGLGYGTYFLFASFMVLMGFWAFFFIPETKGLSLEDMDRIFGVPERAGLGEKEQQVEQVERVDYGVRREDL